MNRLFLVLLTIMSLSLIVFIGTINAQTPTTTTSTTNIPVSTETVTQLPQPVVEEVQQTAQDASIPVAGGTIIATAATAAGLFLNDRKDKKNIERKLTTAEVEAETKNKEKDEIITNINVVLYKIFYAGYIYEHKNIKQILDLKATNNPLEKNTLGEEYALLLNKLSRFTQVNYNLPMPNMSVASPQVIQATSVIPENKNDSSVASVQAPPNNTNQSQVNKEEQVQQGTTT